ncbi:MAG: DUF6286 domain-containing protein [Haloechinothrix sp.]
MRVFIRLLSTLLGIAVAAIGGLVALEVGWQWWRPERAPLLAPWPVWRDRLAGLNWESVEVRTIAGVLVGAGLITLLAALAARRRAIPLLDPATEVSVTTSPRSIARVVGQRVRAHDDVAAASVTATGRMVRVSATSGLRTESELRPELVTVVDELLNDLPLVRKPTVSVTVDSPRDRA